MKKQILFLTLSLSLSLSLFAQDDKKLAEAIDKVETKCIQWRRTIHQNPELGNREVATAKMIADHLRSLGIEVQTGVAKTGVVGILKGGLPGPVIGLRADMDALPVTERAALQFASKVKTVFNGQETGVMHACGHDTHVAMLMSAAEVLAGVRSEIRGTVKFIFQPAEEGPPAGEEGGAKLMVKEGVLSNPDVDVMFGIHINSQTPIGTIKYRKKGMMAAADWFSIQIKGKQSHGAQPWQSIDPVVVGAQIIQGLQTIVSRQTDLTKNAIVISTTMFTGGVRENIIPEEAMLKGTIRTLDTAMQREVWQRIENTAKNIAEASGATAEVTFNSMTLVTYNDPQLTDKMLPSLQKATGGKVEEMNAVMGAEDFSFFAEKVPSLFIFLGGMNPSADVSKVAPHHTPDFVIDERGMKTGVKAFVYFVKDYGMLKAKK